VSNAVAESWADTVKINRRRIDVIPRGIDRGQFGVGDEERATHRASVLEEFQLPGDTFLVIAVGRQEPQKGHRYLLEAAHRLRDGVPSLRILIVGRTGLASGRLDKLIEDLGISDIVTLTGSRTDLPRLLAASDVFAFPSLFEGNGGNAMIEAMAISLPIVTTGVPPMTDLVPSDEFGLLVPRTDSEALAAALARLAADPGLRRTLATAASERAAGFATPEESARRYEAWYREILDVG
jgi:glycosyltransferase involved in cell wall biosynthesis